MVFGIKFIFAKAIQKRFKNLQNIKTQLKRSLIMCKDIIEMIKTNTMPKGYKCSSCGKDFDVLDYQEDFCFNKYIGYGSIYDEKHIQFRLCCDCFDKIFEVIKPMIKDIKVEEYK